MDNNESSPQLLQGLMAKPDAGFIFSKKIDIH